MIIYPWKPNVWLDNCSRIILKRTGMPFPRDNVYGQIWTLPDQGFRHSSFLKIRRFPLKNVQKGTCSRDEHVARTENSQNPWLGVYLRVRGYISPQKNYADLDSTHRELHFLSSYVSELAKLNLKKVRASLGNPGTFQLQDDSEGALLELQSDFT